MLEFVEEPHPSEESEALPESPRADTIAQPSPYAACFPGSDSIARWFALYTTPRHEKRVAQHLLQRQIEHYLPIYRVNRKWSDGSKVVLDLPLFPGYVFVRIPRSDRVRVLEVPGALDLVGGTGGALAALPEEEVEALRGGVLVRRAEPHPLLRAGCRARIRSGAFAGMEGIVVRRKNIFRVVLTMNLIMQSISVEVDEQDLELLEPGTGLPLEGAPASLPHRHAGSVSPALAAGATAGSIGMGQR